MESDEHVSVDDIFEGLSHNRRRLALQYFKQYENPIELDDLAERIARWEQTPTAVPAEVEVEAVRTALHRTHLPKLDELGFIEYQSEREAILTNNARITAAMENAIIVVGFLYDEPAGDDD
ncbi:DUF7344 domain-containing protein [Halomarina oriensis]|uniref:DUF7344 domain-containing protein n=1 Tax=Halomarina oriensis TaxID=671145 RepID=A0A6B0GK62_9EURY|nr:hypothetical protein [Halomarina oriensis]MWG34207.1 hypothetical protein [Halomarina oriensis]